MTHLNKFRDRDDTDEQVRRPKRSICEIKDQDDTTIQVYGPAMEFTLLESHPAPFHVG